MKFKSDRQVAVIKTVLVSDDDQKNCLTKSWENRESPQRCPHMTTICDSTDMCCEAFEGPPIPLENENGSQAEWGDSVVVRCTECRDGEHFLHTSSSFIAQNK